VADRRLTRASASKNSRQAIFSPIPPAACHSGTSSETIVGNVRIPQTTLITYAPAPLFASHYPAQYYQLRGFFLGSGSSRTWTTLGDCRLCGSCQLNRTASLPCPALFGFCGRFAACWRPAVGRPYESGRRAIKFRPTISFLSRRVCS